MKTKLKNNHLIFFFFSILILPFAFSFVHIQETTYVGFLKLKNRVQLNIRFESSNNEIYQVSGSYFHTKKGAKDKFYLEGEFNSITKKIKLKDKNLKGKVIGYLDGKIDDANKTFYGWYAEAKNDKNYVFQLKMKEK